MEDRSKTVQEIAVFGESGSGKTVLVSSFYGATQEPGFAQKSGYNVIAGDQGQGTRLYRNYLGMRNSAETPILTHFDATSYSFTIAPNTGERGIEQNKQEVKSLELIWHDYPGEWFESSPGTSEETKRRADTFRKLLGSDVAYFLVDAQKLLDNSGEEERYLKSLLSNIRNSIKGLKDDLLSDGKRLVQFPRVWIFALSKSDLMPEMNVYDFRDLMIAKVGNEIIGLRDVIGEFVEGSKALSVGEDFALISSAKFEPGQIGLNERVGVDLIVPTAAILPVGRFLDWARQKELPHRIAQHLFDNAAPLVGPLLGMINPKNKILRKVVDQFVGSPDKMFEAFVGLVGENLKKANEKATSRSQAFTALLTKFKMQLDDGEQRNELLRSKR